MKSYNLNRFIDAQLRDYPNALSEVKRGRKQSHWMWYIFPQITGLGMSEISAHYAIKDIEEARAYMQDPSLCTNMLEICGVLLESESNDASRIFGFPDDMKLKSCMTLFAEACPKYEIFQKILDKFFGGMKDQKTIELLKN